MTYIILAILTVSLLACQGLAGEPAAPAKTAVELRVLATHLVGGGGGWDYIQVDPAARRFYIARASRVMILDADQGKLLGEVADIAGAHGVALVPQRNEGFATNGKSESVSVFDLKTFKMLRKIKAGQKPDAILYDPASEKIFACNGNSGDVSIVDPAALDKQPANLAVGGKLEFAVADGAGHVYVNVEDKNEVVAIDSKKGTVLAHWSITPGEAPTGLAMDVAHRRLFVGCSNQKMVVLDAEEGKVIGVAPIGRGVDGVAFDPQLQVAVSANGSDGTISVVREEPGIGYIVAQTLKTCKGARTIAVDPATHRFVLPCIVPAKDGDGSFGVVVVGQ